jgi:dihydroorotate dehydrogenase
MYSLLKKILFQLDPETAHDAALRALKLASCTGLTRLLYSAPDKPCEVMGLHFKNPIGLAAGLDKDGDYIDALATLGFGFIEIGTVTPKPQSGNPRPRLFRLVSEEAIINRMGFNSKGIDYVIKQLEKMQYRGVLGINIGKNKETPLDKAVDDYLAGFRAFWKFASYITVNISSPNTPGLRDLQQDEALTNLLRILKQEQQSVFRQHQKYVPLVVKISPDVSEDELRSMAEIFLHEKVDGVIAANTTIHREGVLNSPYKNESGGLSGRPLLARNNAVVAHLHALLQDRIPIIAAGGVMDATSAQQKFANGAKLVQVYTGFIYAGPGWVKRLMRRMPSPSGGRCPTGGRGNTNRK